MCMAACHGVQRPCRALQQPVAEGWGKRHREFPQLLCRMFLQPLHKVASGQLCFATAIGQCWDLHKVAIVAASS